MSVACRFNFSASTGGEIKSTSDRQLFLLVDVPITDAGLEHLRNLPELEFINLKHTQVSTAAKLAMLKHLRKQSFRETRE